MRTFYTYIMASRSRVLYVGVTNNLARRVNEHRQGLVPSFTKKYRVTRLVYFEEFSDIRVAIAREKELKGWKRSRKVSLIERSNLTWEDLADTLPFFAFYKQTKPHACHPERARSASEGPAF